MLTLSARQAQIVRLLRLHGSIGVATVAHQLGVSSMTIRRDLAALADQGVVDRVHGGAVLRPLESRAAPEAHPTKEPALRFVMLTPGLGYYYGRVLAGAEQAAADLGVHLVYAEHDYTASREEKLLSRIKTLNADGVILSTRQWPRAMSSEALSQLKQLSVPLVLCERPGMQRHLAEYDHVATDHGHGIWLALDHLRQGGHRRITWACRDVYDARVRQELVLRIGTSLGLEINDLTGVHPGAFLPHADACRSIVSSARAHGSTAMLIHNDQEALTVMPALRAAGLRVPQDMSIISSDDERVAVAAPPLTAICPAKVEIGRRCVELLFRRVTFAGDHRATEHVWLLPSLTVRSSTRSIQETAPSGPDAAVLGLGFR